MKEIDWRKVINNMRGPFPETGAEPPAMESIPPKRRVELEDRGQFSKLTTEVYFFVAEENGKTYTMQKHWLTDYGDVTLREALTAIRDSQ